MKTNDNLKEHAHIDSENAIPAGDSSFANLHCKQTDIKLMQSLNKEPYLSSSEKINFCNTINHPCPYTPYSPYTPYTPAFSFFKAPITNTTPHKTVTLRQIYNAIKGNYYTARTQKLRSLLSPLSIYGEGLGVRTNGEGPGVRTNREGPRLSTNAKELELSKEQEARKFKAQNFDYCTFSGAFTTRNNKALIKHSGLICLDFDHLPNTHEMKDRLLTDEYFDTQLLFISPSGNGIKWIISIPPPSLSPFRGPWGKFGEEQHVFYFIAIANYILQTYDVAIDKSGSDLSRACFLPHDPDAYINPKFLISNS